MTQNEADLALRAHIADTIVGPEVIDPMDSINWGHGAPPSREQLPQKDNPSDAPQPTETPKPELNVDHPQTSAESPKVVPTPDIDWESLRDPSTGLIVNKYKTPLEAIKGAGHVVNMAKTALTRNAELEQEISRLRQIAPVSQPLPQPQSITPEPKKEIPTGKLDEVLRRIAEDGGTLDETFTGELRDAFRDTADAIASAAVQKAMNERDVKINAETTKWQEIDNYMRVKYPDSLRYTEEIGLFIKANPLVDIAVGSMLANGREKEATELAYLQYVDARDKGVAETTKAEATTREIQLDAAEQVRKEAIDKARKDAGVATTIAGGVHETSTVPSTQEELDRAAAEMRRTGLGENWRALAFGQYLTDPIFNK